MQNISKILNEKCKTEGSKLFNLLSTSTRSYVKMKPAKVNPSKATEGYFTDCCQFMVHHIRAINFTPFIWDQSQNEIDLKADNHLAIHQKIYFPVCCAYVTIANLRTFYHWQEIKKDTSTLAYCLIFLGISILSVSSSWACLLKRKDIVVCLNEMIRNYNFHRKTGNSNPKMLWLMCRAVGSMLLLVPPFLTNIFLNPCMPPHLGSFFSMHCRVKNSFGFTGINLNFGSKCVAPEVFGRLLIVSMTTPVVLFFTANIFIVCSLLILKGYYILKFGLQCILR